MDVGLRCLAPMMPFLTEELAQRLPKSNVCDLDMYSVHKTEYPTIAQVCGNVLKFTEWHKAWLLLWFVNLNLCQIF